MDKASPIGDAQPVPCTDQWVWNAAQQAFLKFERRENFQKFACLYREALLASIMRTNILIFEIEIFVRNLKSEFENL